MSLMWRADVFPSIILVRTRRDTNGMYQQISVVYSRVQRMRVVEVKHISKSFCNTHLVENVSFDVQKGDI